VLGKGGRNPGAIGMAKRQGAAASLDEERIDVAVVAAVEFNDFVAFGESARQANGAHARLGAAAGHAHLFDAGDMLQISLAIVTSSGLGMPKLVPNSAASLMAAIILGCACPRMAGPKS